MCEKYADIQNSIFDTATRASAKSEPENGDKGM